MQATCHPERRHQALGLCASCYAKQWLAKHPDGTPNRRKTRALCHPTRTHAAHGWCKSCWQTRRHLVHPDYVRERKKPLCHPERRVEGRGLCSACYRKVGRASAKYGLSWDQVLAMGEAQGWACAICAAALSAYRFRGFAIDHDHDTGKVRGLLCDNCNSALGRWRDDVTILTRAIAYLEGI